MGVIRMVVNLMSLGLETTPKIVKAQEMIEATLEKYLDCNEKFTQYNNEKLFLTELSNSVKQDDVIVLATEPELFAPFKSFVAKAFQLRKKPNRQIIKLMRASFPEIKPDTTEFKNQILIPSGSTPLLSNDGLYSGFAIKSNNQIVLVLPLDIERLGTILDIGVVQYLLKTLPEIEEKNQKQEQENKEQLEEENKQPYDENLIKSTVQNLVDEQLSFAIAQTTTLDFIYALSNDVVNLSKVVDFSNYYVEKGQMPPREYAVNLARGAKKGSSSPIGACLSQVFTTSKEGGQTEMFVYVCIADEHQANAVKMFAKAGETPPQLIFSAINELFKMVQSWAKTGELFPPPPTKSAEEIKEVQEIKKDKEKKKTKITIATILSLSVIISIIIAVFFSDIFNIHGSLAQKEQTQMGIIINSDNIFCINDLL